MHHIGSQHYYSDQQIDDSRQNIEGFEVRSPCEAEEQEYPGQIARTIGIPDSEVKFSEECDQT